ncbi:histidine kinase [Paractinoplanes deccanensis]|uniref:histidine kinase n=2 Tax=Paractinoplanes deccanensis TaxID=113561 RepID=A0ABQ3XWZ3_9ACTN|nr:sensor domain-containing protein [Actinoplanes deccanensis]GID72263.1 histidine kinase [Actinoplanes deccanensis]
MVVLVGAPMVLLGLPWAILLQRVVTWDQPALVPLALLLVGGGALIAGLGPLVAVPAAALERRRLRLTDNRPTRSGHRPAPADPVGWIRVRYREPATWRALCYAILLVGAVPVWYGAVLILLVVIAVSLASPFLVDGDGPVSLGVGTVATVGDALPYALFGLALLPAVPYLLAVTAGAHTAAARLLLSASTDSELRAELTAVARSRVRLVDAFEAERARIERDLHDGAQQRLVSLTLQLGLARVDLPGDSPAGQAVAVAHDQAKLLMAELRELIHGIRPQTLTEAGLPAALRELADQATIPVTVRADLPARPPPGVESVAYFAAAEALTNVFKHSQAATAAVTVADHDGILTVEILDDGRGGADPSRGTGLTGLADRVAVADGRMLLSSPAGGPTLIRVEIPCRPIDRSA